uniref:Uncharacterized protein n=1 Tax=viral metagenome TaxID=1070528 RepID=A0A6M3MDT8_9ZZZZ
MNKWTEIKESIKKVLELEGFILADKAGKYKKVVDPKLTLIVDTMIRPLPGEEIPVFFINQELERVDEEFENHLTKTRSAVQMAVDLVLHGKEEEAKPEPEKQEPDNVPGKEPEIEQKKAKSEPEPEPEVKPIPEKEKEKPNTKPQKPSNLPVKFQGKTDAEIDREIENAKTRKFLENRGESYKVRGTERPDAHAIQHAANDAGICIEIVEATQTAECCHVIVRGHLGGQYVDAVVHHEFELERRLKIMEMVAKNPEILDHYDGLNPVIKADAKITIVEYGKTKVINAMYYIVHSILTQQKFSIRDARTKAASIAEAMLLNKEHQTKEEKASEYEERETVQDSMNTKVIK